MACFFMTTNFFSWYISAPYVQDRLPGVIYWEIPHFKSGQAHTGHSLLFACVNSVLTCLPSLPGLGVKVIAFRPDVD